MANVGCVAITVDVGSPFEFRGICVARPYIASLELLQLLLSTEFVGLEQESAQIVNLYARLKTITVIATGTNVHQTYHDVCKDNNTL